MLLESFLQSQKVAIARQLRKKFDKYTNRAGDSTQLLLHTLKRCVSERVSTQFYLISNQIIFLFYSLFTKKRSKHWEMTKEFTWRCQWRSSNTKPVNLPDPTSQNSTKTQYSKGHTRSRTTTLPLFNLSEINNMCIMYTNLKVNSKSI